MNNISIDITGKSVASFVLSCCVSKTVDRSLETLTTRVNDGPVFRIMNRVGCFVVSHYITGKVNAYVDQKLDQIADVIVNAKEKLGKIEMPEDSASQEEVLEHIKETVKSIVNDANKELEEKANEHNSEVE